MESLLKLDIQFFATDIESQLKEAVEIMEKTRKQHEEAMKTKSEEVDELKKKHEETLLVVNELKQKYELAQEEAAKKAAAEIRINSYGQEEDKVKDAERKKIFMKYVRGGSMTKDEMKVLKDVGAQVKALVEDATGEIIVPEDLDRVLQTEKMDNVVMRSLARVLPTTSNRMRRRAMNDVDAGWGKLELNKPAGGIKDFESTLVPTEEYLYVENLYGYTRIGEDELEDTDLNLEAYLAESFRRVFIREEGRAFLQGKGHSSLEPEGLLLDPNITKLETATAGQLDADDLLSLQYEVHSGYRSQGVYLVDSNTELEARKLKDNNGNYIWQTSARDGIPATLWGKPVYVQDDFEDENGEPLAAAVFGDFKSGYTILDRKGTTIKRYNESQDAIERDLIPFKAKQRVGGGVTDPKAFAMLVKKK